MILYRINHPVALEAIIKLYDDSGLVRPTSDKERIATMYKHSNLVISAWENDELVGISRSLTDFRYCCYLSDLAVKKSYQRSGIGKMLIRKTQEEIGEETMLLLLSAPSAMEYYPRIGMDKVENGFVIKRKR